MRLSFILIAVLVNLTLTGAGQQTDTTGKARMSIAFLSGEMQKLVKRNASIQNGLDLSKEEAVSLQQATAPQLIVVTAPYLNSTVPNARYLCQRLLMHALFYQVKNETEKQNVLEILCRDFLDKDHIHFLNNTLPVLSEKDFNARAKKYVARLMDGFPGIEYRLSAKFLSVAQIKESIPLLWKIVDTNVRTMQHSDLDVLTCLARMNEQKAGVLLSDYYNSDANKWGDFSNKTGESWRHFLVAKSLAFSLDRTVLNSFIKEFRSIDLNYFFHDGDTGFYPAQYLGACIVSMIKNYPFEKEDNSLKPKQLLEWLATNDIQLKDR